MGQSCYLIHWAYDSPKICDICLNQLNLMLICDRTFSITNDDHFSVIPFILPPTFLKNVHFIYFTSTQKQRKYYTMGGFFFQYKALLLYLVVFIPSLLLQSVHRNSQQIDKPWKRHRLGQGRAPQDYKRHPLSNQQIFVIKIDKSSVLQTQRLAIQAKNQDTSSF